MTTRPVSARIETPTGGAREGLRVDFHADDPAQSTHAVTDAGGVFVAELVVGMTYRVPAASAATVNGETYPAGTVFVATVPEGEGPVDLSAVTVNVEDWSLPTITRMFADLEARLAALETTP